MSEKLIRNDLLNEEYYEIDHSSGLKIFVMEKPDYSGAFAMFGTRYGSVDTCFRLKGEKIYTSANADLQVGILLTRLRTLFVEQFCRTPKQSSGNGEK